MSRIFLFLSICIGAGALALLLFYPKETKISIQKEVAQEQQPVVGQSLEPKYYTYYYNRSTVGFESLQQNIERVDVVIAEALALKSANGDLGEINRARQAEIVALAKSKGVAVHALLSNNDAGWQSERTVTFLNNPDARRRTAMYLKDYLNVNGYAGVSIDFEKLPTGVMPNYYAFLSELRTELQEKNISVHFYINDRNPNYGELGKNVDQVILMAYDQHDTTTIAGPIAAWPWVQSNLENLLEQMQASKVVLGLANYAYDWSVSGVQSKAVLMAQSLAKQKGIEIGFDKEVANSFYQYEEQGMKHEVWLLDQLSVQHALTESRDYDLAGYALFRTGSEDPDVWRVFGKQK